jgi:NTP pyrophosphatase (non-canonical NTP hydrolase)
MSEFEAMVDALAKPGEAILASLTPEKAHLLHMAVGIAGEAGELLDAIKKHVIYNKEPDLKNIVEELGDLEFYMEGMRAKLGIHRDFILRQNMYKLEERYKGFKYTDQAAQDRADKVAA